MLLDLPQGLDETYSLKELHETHKESQVSSDVYTWVRALSHHLQAECSGWFITLRELLGAKSTKGHWCMGVEFHSILPSDACLLE